ncbi:MAG: hypothetical protein U0441_20625 [Polyangiaceae bacterium]
MSTTSIRLSLAIVASLAFVQGCVAPAVDSTADEDIGEAEQAVIPSGGTLTMLDHRKVCSLFGSGQNGDYEASGVQVVGSDLYVIFDNKNQVGKIPFTMNASPNNWLSNNTATYTPGTLQGTQWEAITYDSNNTTHFYTMQEVLPPVVAQLDGSGSAQNESYTTLSGMGSFGSSNHYFEGLAWLRQNNNDYLLALCQNGGCGGANSTAPATLRVLAQSGSTWDWTNQQTITLAQPGTSTGPFASYNDVALRFISGTSYKIAIVSADSSKLWIGALDASTWTLSTGNIYSFPTGTYPNMEGVTFLSDTQIAMVSDSGNTAGTSCQDGTNDESVFIFSVP